MTNKIYVDENPRNKKTVHFVKTVVPKEIKDIKKYNKNHSHDEVQDKIQHVLTQLVNRANNSGELSSALNNFLVKRDDVKPHLEDYINHPNWFSNKYGTSFYDIDDAKKTLKIMNNHPNWRYYINGNGGENEIMLSSYNECSLQDLCDNLDYLDDMDKSTLEDFFCEIRLYDIDALSMIVSDTSDYYDDDYEDKGATQKKEDKQNNTQMFYPNEKAKYTEPRQRFSGTVNHGAYLIKAGFELLKSNHHSWKDIKKIISGLHLVKGISGNASFKKNFTKKGQSKKAVCSKHSSKFWINAFNNWLKRNYMDEKDINKAAKQYIRAKEQMNKYDKARQTWTKQKRNNYLKQNHKKLSYAKHELKLGIKHGEKQSDNQHHHNYFTYNKRHFRYGTKPYVIEATFYAHQPYCIDKSNVKLENYLDFSAKLNLKTRQITFSDNCSIDSIGNDLFGAPVGIQNNKAIIKKFSAKNKDEIATDLVNFFTMINGKFEDMLATDEFE